MGATLLLERGGYLTQIATQIRAINTPLSEHRGRRNLGARDGSKDAELTGLEPLFSTGDAEETSIEDFKWRLRESFKSSSRSNYSGKTQFRVSHLPEEFIFQDSPLDPESSSLDPESVMDLIHQIEEQDALDRSSDELPMTSVPARPARPKKHKKLLRRRGGPKPEQAAEPQPVQETAAEYPVMPDLPTTCFTGNNLVPVVPRNLHGVTYKKDERASGIRSQELFLSARYCCGKKNPSFRRLRRLIIRHKHGKLAA